MRKLIVFNHVTLDGYFTDRTGDMSWAHKQDAEWNHSSKRMPVGEANSCSAELPMNSCQLLADTACAQELPSGGRTDE